MFGLNETNEPFRLLQTVNHLAGSRKGSVVVPKTADSVVADQQLRRPYTTRSLGCVVGKPEVGGRPRPVPRHLGRPVRPDHCA